MLLEKFIRETLLLENKMSFTGFLDSLVRIIDDKLEEEKQCLLKDNVTKFIYQLVKSGKTQEVFSNKKEKKNASSKIKSEVDSYIKHLASSRDEEGFGSVLVLSRLPEYYNVLLNYFRDIERADLEVIYEKTFIDILSILSYHKTYIYESLESVDKEKIFRGEVSITDIHLEAREFKFRVKDGLDSKKDLLSNSTLILSTDKWYIVMPHTHNSFYEWSVSVVDSKNNVKREDYKTTPSARVRWCTSVKGNDSHWRSYWSEKDLVCMIAIQKEPYYNASDDLRRISLKYKISNNDNLNAILLSNYYVKYDEEADNWDTKNIYNLSELVSKYPDSYDYEYDEVDYHRFIDLDNLKTHYNIDLSSALDKKLEETSGIEFYYSSETVDADNMAVLDNILSPSEDAAVIKSLTQNHDKIQEVYNLVSY